MRWGSKELATNGKKQTVMGQKEKSLGSKQKYLESAKWNENNVPYKWKEVVDKYPHYLTRYEMEEIKEYKNVYYIGHKLSRV